LAFLAGNAAVFAYAWWKRTNVRARLAAVQVAPSQVADAAEGIVHLAGKVVARGKLLSAVIDRTACVFSDVIVENTGRWPAVIMLREVRGVGFDLDDGTGVAEIAFEDQGPSPPLSAGPRFVECAIPRRRAEGRAQYPGWRPGPIAERILAEHGRKPPGLLHHTCRACEGIIRPGDHVSVIGRGAREVSGDAHAPGYRGAPWRYVVRAAADVPLTISKKS
jgi:hypothetical protein